MLRSIVATTLCLLVVGCANVGYYAQAVGGQMQLMAATRPITEVVNDSATDPKVRKQLQQVGSIREFASSELALPNNGSYRSYSDLGRPYVVWNVFAAPEFSMDPQQWCMLVVGCVSYRGYYDKDEAELYAGELKQAGVDTYVGGVPTYSTLGYFDDPVLNTFLRFGELEVARIMFHELAHQLVYAEGDSVFNESFATAVEIEGMRRWLTRSGTPERLRAFEAHQERKVQFYRLIADCRDKLRAVYSSSLAPKAMRDAKKQEIAGMKQAYADLKASWGGYSGFDQWFNQPLNNAALASVSMYTQLVPAFHALLEQEGGSLPRFYRRVAALAQLPKIERLAVLDQLRASRTASVEPVPLSSPQAAGPG